MAVRTDKETFTNLVRFPCQMNPAFVPLVKTEEPVALLILAYWLAKMLEVDIWWLRARARSELFAICSYLDTGPDERFQTLLKNSMEACAYISINLDMIET